MNDAFRSVILRSKATKDLMNYSTYILTNKSNNVLYVGVTNNLERRIFEHKNKLISGFTERYNLNKLVWFEQFPNVVDAISAEKKIKGLLRIKKIKLIEEKNPSWKDLSDADSSPRIKSSFRMTKIRSKYARRIFRR